MNQINSRREPEYPCIRADKLRVMEGGDEYVYYADSGGNVKLFV